MIKVGISVTAGGRIMLLRTRINQKFLRGNLSRANPKAHRLFVKRTPSKTGIKIVNVFLKYSKSGTAFIAL
ncbi:unnamed protein product [marine sediment metagenome]|uniref:Uncharacterized protein n=1 Tax=marine sediment metagenome TaxID=412755 RepID=X1IVV0_9ZZZZ